MDTFKFKLRHTLPTFITLIVSVIILYCLSRWVITTLTDIKIDNVVWEIYIPVLLPWIPCIYFLNRKFSSTELKTTVSSRFLPILCCIVTISAMLIMLNRYTKESKETITVIPNITKIDSVKVEKYVKLQEYFVNKFGGHHIHYTKSAKSTSNRLNMNIYFALPLLKNKKEGIRDFPKYWYGLKFNMWTNGGTSTYMRELEQEFLKECQQKITEMSFEDEKYFELVKNPAYKLLYEKAINSIPIPKDSAQYTILTPSFKSFNHKATVALYCFFSIFIFGTIMFIASLSDQHLKMKNDKNTTLNTDS
ncbi:hypothetical protein [Pedobacter psychroterrae]|uniref:Uncharacterized protein n=1 Tax=Pedobacter psychroterrae TaxID=2530453 RepID=A0A4R0NIC9_9SPHI|nr:hypothetical protein [Pedobacter psychroterrae]TCD00226.1 hypothetical protein EZ437_16070 [Pedobacter psychroterrae]